jgi:AcrR family transcriptional regulator
MKIDRRITRSKALLRNALRELMAQKRFKDITVGQISDLSTINRATFYKHYVDKHSLLEEVFQEDFEKLLETRTRETKALDRKFLRQTIHAVADFLLPIGLRRLDEHNTFIPLEQKTVQQTIVDKLLTTMGAKTKTNGELLKVRVKAAMAGWAIYAAVNQWVQLHLENKLNKKDSTIESFADKIVDPITGLIK